MNEATIFAAALEKPTDDERAALVAEACQGDERLRRRVEALLRAHAEADDILDPPSRAEHTGAYGVWATPGTLIGQYKLVERIGEGGMGQVWMSQQQEPVKRIVALKLIKAGMDSKTVIARFGAERQALALMDHPNIAKVHDAGTTPDGRPFFVMELVKGKPITKYCDEHHLTPRQRLELFIPVCQAVQHAHQKGIIHRDLKPSNVLVALYDGRPVPKVIDFGVAKAAGQPLTEQTLVTGFDAIVGTLEYMSPEQAEINQLDIDTRSDIYSLGVLLYELLTGSPPFTRKELEKAGMLEMLRVIREQEPSKPSTKLSTAEGLPTLAANRGTEPAKLAKLVRGELDWIVMKALEKDRGRRYETANGFAMDVQRYLADEPVVACPPSSLYRCRKFVRRHKAGFLTASAAALVLLLTVVGLAVSNILITREKNRVLAEQETSKYRLFEAKLAEAKANRRSGQVGQRFDSLRALREAAEIARELELDELHRLTLRNEAIACMCLTDLRPLRDWNSVGELPSGAFDGDFRRYAHSDGQGNVTIRRTDDDRVLVQLLAVGGPGQIDWLSMSPDGRLLAVRHERSARVSIWDLNRKEVVLQAPQGFLCDFAPDGRRVAVTCKDGSIGVYDLSTGVEERRLTSGRAAGPHADTFCFFDGQGSKLAAYHLHAREVHIWDLRSDGPAKTLACADPVYALAWHPGGGLLAIGDTRMRIHLWNLQADRPHKILEGHDLTVTGLTFDRAGDLLASTSWDGTTCLWDPRVGKLLVRTLGSSRPQFSADGRRLAVGNLARRTVLEVNPEQVYRALHHGSGFGSQVSAAAGPDGRLLASASWDGVRIADLASGTEVGWLDIGMTYTVQFDSTGEHLFTGGRAGLHCWRVAHLDRRTGYGVRIGPPQSLYTGTSHAVLRGGKTFLVWNGGQQAVVLDAESLAIKLRLNTPVQMFGPSVSPDGRWVAIGTFGQDVVRIWDAQTGHLVHQFANPGFGGSRAAFSPDGHWLVASGGLEYLCLEVGSWRECWRQRCGFGGEMTPPIAFAPDGRLLAIASTPRDVTLLDPATGREFCTLAAPTPQFIHQLCFSPDGGQLLASNDRSQALPVWDLRRVREELVALGLDWSLPPYPPPPTSRIGERVQIEVDYGGLRETFLAQEHFARGLANARAKKWREAIADYSKGVALKPDDPSALNNLAWHLVTCPDPELHDPQRAVELAKKAVELDPQANCWNTLGVAHYRAAEFKEALAALNKAIGLRKAGDSFDWFFVAMSHWQLGNKDEARMWYDQAIAWMEKHQPSNEELSRFRAEAMEMLGVKKKSG